MPLPFIVFVMPWDILSAISIFGTLLRAAGDTKTPMKVGVLVNIINVVLNMIFVIVFHMGVAGVGIATVASQDISALLVMRALTLREDSCHLNRKAVRIYKDKLIEMIKIGFPAGIQGSLFSLANVIIQSSVNSFGSVVVAGNAAAANIEGFVYWYDADGDANGDGNIDSSDVILLRNYMANYDYETGASSVTVDKGADANGDGEVGSTDVLLMRKYMANYDYNTGTSSVILGPKS